MITQEFLQTILSYDRQTGEFTWNIDASKSVKKGSLAGRTSNKGYRQISFKGKLYSSHRLAWLYCYGSWPNGVIDHINGIRTDNSLRNLRDVTLQCNLQNLRLARSNNKTGYLGVCWAKSENKYKASVKINGKSIHLGYFDDPKIAHDEYLKAKRRLHEGCTI